MTTEANNHRTVFIELEKPLADLYEQLDNLKEMEKKGDVNLTTTIQSLERQIDEVKEELYKNLTPWERVQLSRHPERPYSLFYFENIFEDFIELHGDRNISDDKAIVGGLAKLNGEPVMVIGHQKGHNTKARQYRNFGMANPEGYRKALRLMRLAEKFNIPVITFIDTPGAYPGIEAEDRGQAEAIARNIYEMSKLQTNIICYIIGEGASGGALGIGVGDRVYMLENTWYTVISPENCSTILWRSWEYKEQAAESLKLTAPDLLEQGIIDRIISEPFGGAHKDHKLAAENLRAALIEELDQLIKIKPEKLVDNRIEKFGKMGVFTE